MNRRKFIAGTGLAVILLAIGFAAFSFLQENWGADQTPGRLETVLARWFLSRAHPADEGAPNQHPPTPANLEQGRLLYELHCAFCHGLDGMGAGEQGIQFYPPVPSLARPELPLTDAQMHSIVQRGIRYTAMPSYSRVLTEEETWKTLLWVRNLQSQTPE